MVNEEAYTPTRNIFTGMAVCKKVDCYTAMSV